MRAWQGIANLYSKEIGFSKHVDALKAILIVVWVFGETEDIQFFILITVVILCFVKLCDSCLPIRL